MKMCPQDVEPMKIGPRYVELMRIGPRGAGPTGMKIGDIEPMRIDP